MRDMPSLRTGILAALALAWAAPAHQWLWLLVLCPAPGSLRPQVLMVRRRQKMAPAGSRLH